MYQSFFGLKEAPFNLTPNSKFFFGSHKHQEALDSLIYSINHRKGFLVITGDIGSGKTTVCRTLLHNLDRHTEVALITNTHLNARDLLGMVLEDLSIEFNPGWSKSRLLSALNDYLIQQARQDNNVVLIIDEAQNLKAEVLEEIRMLSNLETETDKLIQIVLLGQPELKDTLAMASLEQLRQRVSVYFHLTPLDKQETKAYVIHRLRVASGSNREYFTDGALEAVYAYSKGIPRLINQVCDFGMLTAFTESAEIVDERIMKEVINESPMVQFEKKKRLVE